jgi:2-desacetyl-2-hydroxyethyl bacteriochlorophyllide A dehydrogenase
MQIYLLYGSKDIRLSEKLIPEPGPEEILIKPKFTGICGSDIHYFQHGYCGNFFPKQPFALGHEFAGVVHQLGANVKNFKVGDEVAVDPSMPCCTCKHCKSGHYNLCLSMRYFGSASCEPHIDGSMGQFLVAPSSNCYRLPIGISLAQASLLEPLCVAMHAVKQVKQIAGNSILITGGGPIGQLILRVVKAFGAFDVTVSDVNDFARAFSLKSGASKVVNPIDENAWGHLNSFDVVFEASGSPNALADAIQNTRRGGSVVLVGTLPSNFSIPGNLIMNKQLKLFGSFRFANVFEEAMKMVAAGIINLDGIVTHTFSFNEIPKAMECALEKDNVMKVQIEL